MSTYSGARRCIVAFTAVLILGACSVVAPSPSASAVPSSGASSTSVPSANGCPTGDVTLSELIAVPRTLALLCFGDRMLTLRGWVWEDRGAYDCVKELPPDLYPPDWLYCAATDHLRLTPVPYPPGEPLPGFIRPEDGPFSVAVDPDSAAAAVLRPSRWVEVVGRFGDPVTARCATVETGFREQCLSAFVVSEAREIEAPLPP